MIDAGQLHFKLAYRAGHIQDVSLISTRPLHISRILTGKTPEQVLTLLPLLFNVCGIAQAFAALTACQQALGLPENPEANAARQALLNMEIAREHCWWLMVDTDKAGLAPIIQLLNRFKQTLFINGNAFSLNSQLHVDNEAFDFLITSLEQLLDAVFAGHRQSFLEVHNQQALLDWLDNNQSIPARLCHEIIAHNWQRTGQCDFSFLPTLDTQILQQRLSQNDAQQFIQQPDWQGKVYETGCLARQGQQPIIKDLWQEYGNGLLTRLMSRLVELAHIPNLLRQDRITTKPTDFFGEKSSGLAQISSSRGLLIHRMVLKQGIIQHYQIIAPTEWNFHPEGIAVHSLRQLKADNEHSLRQQAHWIIKAIDPCVGFQLDLC